MSDALFSWLATYAIHSSLLGVAGWIALRWLARDTWRESTVRCALFGALLTTTLAQFAGGGPALEMPADLHPLASPSLVTERVAQSSSPAAESKASHSGRTGTVQNLSLQHLALALWLAPALVLAGRRLYELATIRSRVRAVRAGRRLHTLPGLSESQQTRVVVTSEVETPLAAFGVVLFPEHLADSLDSSQRNAIVRHELAHLERADPLWFALAALQEALFFFQPFHRWQRRRLVEIAERRSDQWAIERGSDPLDLAGALVRVGRETLSIASASMAGGNLSERVRHLLRGKSNPERNTALRWLAAGLLLALLITLGPRAQLAALVTEGTVESVRAWVVASSLSGDTSSSSDRRRGQGDLRRELLDRGHRAEWNELLIWARPDGRAVGFETPRSAEVDASATEWLGRLDGPASLREIERLWLTAPAESRRELAGALALHEELDFALAAGDRLLREEAEPSVHEEFISWLGRRPRSNATMAALETFAFRSELPAAQQEAVEALRRVGCAACLERIADRHPSHTMREEANENLARLEPY